MSFVGRFICIEKFNLCMLCCPLNSYSRLSTNGGFTVVVVVVVEATCISLGLSLGFSPVMCAASVCGGVCVLLH